MKKVVLSAILAFIALNMASAQEALTVTQERLSQLASLTANNVKETGNDIIDNYTDALYDLTDDVVDNGKDLTTLLENVKSGAVSKVSALAEANSLSTKISDASAKAKNVFSTAKEATSQIKNLKGFSLKSLATKTLANNTKISSLLGEETVSQVKTMASLISLLKN
ncbi:MAG: hypothetical protein J6L02_02725 [Bacteroidales bacterium]|nr:hypothetical protein [Bacteroidales bacterium]